MNRAAYLFLRAVPLFLLRLQKAPYFRQLHILSLQLVQDGTGENDTLLLSAADLHDDRFGKFDQGFPDFLRIERNIRNAQRLLFPVQPQILRIQHETGSVQQIIVQRQQGIQQIDVNGAKHLRGHPAAHKQGAKRPEGRNLTAVPRLPVDAVRLDGKNPRYAV